MDYLLKFKLEIWIGLRKTFKFGMMRVNVIESHVQSKKRIE